VAVAGHGRRGPAVARGGGVGVRAVGAGEAGCVIYLLSFLWLNFIAVGVNHGIAQDGRVAVLTVSRVQSDLD
jgi:hypothetical protein